MKYLVGFGLIAAVAACVQSASMPDASEGAAIFAENCAQCHGTGGKGDGPWAKGMTLRPAAPAFPVRRCRNSACCLRAKPCLLMWATAC